jgi:hypothetical protein
MVWSSSDTRELLFTLPFFLLSRDSTLLSGALHSYINHSRRKRLLVISEFMKMYISVFLCQFKLHAVRLVESESPSTSSHPCVRELLDVIETFMSCQGMIVKTSESHRVKVLWSN